MPKIGTTPADQQKYFNKSLKIKVDNAITKFITDHYNFLQVFYNDSKQSTIIFRYDIYLVYYLNSMNVKIELC